MVKTQISRKISWGHRVCLGDIMQNIAKMGVFCSFSEGSLGRVLQKLAFKNRTHFNLSDSFYQMSI